MKQLEEYRKQYGDQRAEELTAQLWAEAREAGGIVIQVANDPMRYLAKRRQYHLDRAMALMPLVTALEELGAKERRILAAPLPEQWPAANWRN